MFPAFHDLGTVASRTANARGPTQLADNFIALGIIDQGLDVNEHAIHQLIGMTAILPQIAASP